MSLFAEEVDRFGNYALNCDEMKRLIAASRRRDASIAAILGAEALHDRVLHRDEIEARLPSV